jgi:hypothetical protein
VQSRANTRQLLLDLLEFFDQFLSDRAVARGR